MTQSIYTGQGERKYLTESERNRFLAEAAKEELPFFLLCLVYCLTGCRVSEALELSPARIDLDDSVVRFRTLKRRRTVWRNVPVPSELLQGLQLITHCRDTPLFRYSRTTVWRRIKTVMQRAEICGSKACPKSLRHYFGVHADQQSIPQPILQRWMGHARPESTAIYRQAVGPEEHALASRLCWISTWPQPKDESANKTPQKALYEQL